MKFLELNCTVIKTRITHSVFSRVRGACSYQTILSRFSLRSRSFTHSFFHGILFQVSRVKKSQKLADYEQGIGESPAEWCCHSVQKLVVSSPYPKLLQIVDACKTYDFLLPDKSSDNTKYRRDKKIEDKNRESLHQNIHNLWKNRGKFIREFSFVEFILIVLFFYVIVHLLVYLIPNVLVILFLYIWLADLPFNRVREGLWMAIGTFFIGIMVDVLWGYLPDTTRNFGRLVFIVVLCVGLFVVSSNFI